MLRNIIELPDGTQISSGSGADRAITDCTITGCVNSEKELTIGSACSACVEATIITKDVPLGMTAGQQIKLYKVDDAGMETRVGTFRLEPPTKKSDNVYKITAYDLMVNFDKDMSQWLKEFDDWGCTLGTFADKLCTACGMKLASMGFPNSNFPVSQFYKSGITGRKILSWIGEVAGSFCVVDDVNVSFRWYTDSGVTIRATGDRYYFAGALTFEDHEVAAIDAVKLRLADSDDGALWPSGDADNPYIITGNHILLARVTEDLLPYLEAIKERLAALPAYKPCKVSLPAGVDIQPGHTVCIEDKHGNQFTTCVMTKTQNGQRDTLECTGSERRDSATAVNNKSVGRIAQEAVDAQSQMSIFNKLTNGGEVQGLFFRDGKVYLNVTYAVTGILQSKDQKTFYLDLDNGVLKMEATELSISGKTVDTIAQEKIDAQTHDDVFGKLTNNGEIQGINVENGKWYINAETIAAGILRSVDGKTYFDLDNAEIVSVDESGVSMVVRNGSVYLYGSDGSMLLRLGQNNFGNTSLFFFTEGSDYGFYASGAGLFLQADDLDDEEEFGERRARSYKIGWKSINGIKTLVARD